MLNLLLAIRKEKKTKDDKKYSKKNNSSNKDLFIVLLTLVLVMVAISTINQPLTGNSQQAPQQLHTINIELDSSKGAGSLPMPFKPNTLFIHRGDTVTWVNQDTVNHTVTSLAFSSGIISPAGSSEEKSSFNHTFNTSGTYVYFDRLYPYMGGIIYVDVQESQRELISTTGVPIVNVKVEMPQNSAYMNNYGPYYIPANSQIEPGTRITWTNKDYVAHTATATDGRSFDTNAVLPGQSVSTNISQKEGVIMYYCKIHPWMLGSLSVFATELQSKRQQQ